MTYHYYRKDPTDRMFERLSKNETLDKTMHQIEANPNEDPVVREMAQTVIKECNEGRKRRERNHAINIIGGFLTILFIIGLVIYVLNQRNK